MPMNRYRQWLDSVASKREKCANVYFWCKVFALAFNALYMVRTFGGIYRTIDEVSQAHSRQDGSHQWIAMQSAYQILFGTLVTLCLIIDLFVLASRDLLVASWYWRPGVFFAALLCCDKAVTLTQVLMNGDRLRQMCFSRVFSTSAPNPMVFEVCDMDMRVTQLWYMLTTLRDVLESMLYVCAGLIFVRHRTQVLNSNRDASTPMGPVCGIPPTQSPAWSDAYTVIQAPRHVAVPYSS